MKRRPQWDDLFGSNARAPFFLAQVRQRVALTPRLHRQHGRYPRRAAECRSPGLHGEGGQRHDGQGARTRPGTRGSVNGMTRCGVVARRLYGDAPNRRYSNAYRLGHSPGRTDRTGGVVLVTGPDHPRSWRERTAQWNSGCSAWSRGGGKDNTVTPCVRPGAVRIVHGVRAAIPAADQCWP